MIEWHALQQRVHFKRRLEEVTIAALPHMKPGEQRQILRRFEQYAEGGDEGVAATEQTESEMPLSAEDFARMMKEEHG